MTDFTLGVVCPVGPERDVRPLLASLDAQSRLPRFVVFVWDGVEPYDVASAGVPVRHVVTPKHHPGAEQPRNIGVRHLRAVAPDCTHVWFCDSDLVYAEGACEAFSDHAGDHVMLGPYEWLTGAEKGLQPSVRNDPRWPAFDALDGQVLYGDLGSAVGHFSGNVVWPISLFQRLGGFHSDLFHGRCEDGELGLRAVESGVGVMYVAGARGYHQEHSVDLPLILERNRRDVPLLAEWHPWVLDALRFSDEDGCRLDWVCPHGRASHLFGIWNGCDCEVNA